MRILASKPNPYLVKLPWDVPLEEWDDEYVIPLPRGLSRHVVRFVRVGEYSTKAHFAQFIRFFIVGFEQRAGVVFGLHGLIPVVGAFFIRFKLRSRAEVARCAFHLRHSIVGVDVD